MFIRKATEVDVRSFEMSVDDIMEMQATEKGRDLASVLLSHLTPTSVVLTDGCGVVYAYGGNQGDNVWFLTSHKVSGLTKCQKREFFRLVAEYRDLMLRQYGSIWNYVWSGNKSHIRFLKLLGATFHEEWTVSPATGERFQLFTISKEVA